MEVTSLERPKVPALLRGLERGALLHTASRCTTIRRKSKTFFIFHYYSRDSETCAIQLPTSVILTGGLYTLTKVSEYSEAGYLRDLPQLLHGRDMHGCSYYDNEEGSKVTILLSLILKETGPFRHS